MKESIKCSTYFLHQHPHPIEVFDDTTPVHNPRLYDIIELENDEAIAQIAVQVMHKWRYTHAVHPVTIH